MWNCLEKFYLEKNKHSAKNISLTIKYQLIIMEMFIELILSRYDPTYYEPVNLTQTQNVY